MSRTTILEGGAGSTVWQYSAPPPPPPLPLRGEALARSRERYRQMLYMAGTHQQRAFDSPVDLGFFAEGAIAPRSANTGDTVEVIGHSLYVAAAYHELARLGAEIDPRNWFQAQVRETDDCGSRIADAATPEDIASVLRQRGMVRSAGRIVSLSELHGMDPDEPEVDLVSLRRLATAMVENSAWGEPRLTLNDEGCLHAEWSTAEDGRIAMTFLPSDLVDFAAISAPVKSGADVKRIGGRHIGVEAINAVRWFAARIAPR